MAKKENKKNKVTGVPKGTPPKATPNGATPNQPVQIPPTNNLNNTVIDKSQLTPEQLTQIQLEEAIKESTDPSARLKKLKSPLSVGGCLLNIFFLILVTLVIVFIIVYFMVDKFNILEVAKDMLDKFGITDFFIAIGNWFKKLFGVK